eukprot:168546-Chlamydomonas_euryale.AAC.1
MPASSAPRALYGGLQPSRTTELALVAASSAPRKLYAWPRLAPWTKLAPVARLPAPSPALAGRPPPSPPLPPFVPVGIAGRAVSHAVPRAMLASGGARPEAAAPRPPSAAAPA